jgi:hypothetical protein
MFWSPAKISFRLFRCTTGRSACMQRWPHILLLSGKTLLSYTGCTHAQRHAQVFMSRYWLNQRPTVWTNKVELNVSLRSSGWGSPTLCPKMLVNVMHLNFRDLQLPENLWCTIFCNILQRMWFTLRLRRMWSNLRLNGAVDTAHVVIRQCRNNKYPILCLAPTNAMRAVVCVVNGWNVWGFLRSTYKCYKFNATN